MDIAMTLNRKTERPLQVKFKFSEDRFDSE